MKKFLAFAFVAILSVACGGDDSTCTGANCAATDVQQNGDTQVTGGDCAAAEACCAKLVAQYGASYQAACDKLNGETAATCNSTLVAWHSGGLCN